MYGAAARLLPGAVNAGNKTRMAGDNLQKILKFLKNSAKFGITGSTETIGRSELAKQAAARFVPDVIGGAIVGATTPGDIGDKLIAGTTDALAGAIGGVGLSGIARRPGMLGLGLDMGGSMAGAYAGMPISDQILRMKDSMQGGQGLSPYEKLDAQRRAEIEQALLTKLGFGPLY